MPRRKAREEANRDLLQRTGEPVDLETGPREMTKADFCNVEFINSSDLDDFFDGIIEAASFQHSLEDCECRWNIADVDHDLMDLSDPVPFKGKQTVPSGPCMRPVKQPASTEAARAGAAIVAFRAGHGAEGSNNNTATPPGSNNSSVARTLRYASKLGLDSTNLPVRRRISPPGGW